MLLEDQDVPERLIAMLNDLDDNSAIIDISTTIEYCGNEYEITITRVA